MKIWVLIGLGPNDVNIPCLWFSTKAAAYAYISPILGEPDRENSWTLETKINGRFKSLFGPSEVNGDWVESPVTKKFYTNYYGGCGECYRVELREVEEATPFVGFDLD